MSSITSLLEGLKGCRVSRLCTTKFYISKIRSSVNWNWRNPMVLAQRTSCADRERRRGVPDIFNEEINIAKESFCDYHPVGRSAIALNFSIQFIQQIFLDKIACMSELNAQNSIIRNTCNISTLETLLL